jgi:hypothetical protein
MLASAPAKAISYSFTGTSTFACNGGSDTCTLSFNDFTIDWDGSDWTFNTASTSNYIQVANGAANIRFNTDEAAFAYSDAQVVTLTQDSNAIGLEFASNLPSPAVAPNLTLLSQITVVSPGNSLLATSGNQLLTGSAQAYAAPYFASALTLLPMLAASKRIKRRSLSI